MNASKRDAIWKTESVVQHYLTGTRLGLPLASEQFDVMLRILKGSKLPMQRFLDLGCGDGILGHVLLDTLPHSDGVFLDFSDPMLDAARQRLAAYQDRAVFICSDYGDVGWIADIAQYAPFDAIVSGFSIHHQPDERKRTLYQQLYDLLKPGGVFLNLEHVAPASVWTESLMDDLIIDLTYANQQGKTREEVAQAHHNRLDRDANLLAPVELQCEWLREIGFQHVDYYLKIFELALFGGVRSTT